MARAFYHCMIYQSLVTEWTPNIITSLVKLADIDLTSDLEHVRLTKSNDFLLNVPSFYIYILMPDKLTSSFIIAYV